jgi:hypothetical protein
LHRILRDLARRIFPVLTVVIGLMFVAGSGKAQSLGYGFIGATAGDLSGAFRYGLGAEWATAPHISIGGEIGGLQKNTSGLLVSGNLTGHIPPRGSALDPFVTGGISVAHLPYHRRLWKPGRRCQLLVEFAPCVSRRVPWLSRRRRSSRLRRISLWYQLPLVIAPRQRISAIRYRGGPLVSVLGWRFIRPDAEAMAALSY